MGTKKKQSNQSRKTDERLAGIIFGGVLMVPLGDIHGRLAARTYAYSVIAAGDEELGNLILDEVGEED